jgi:hypothetical protein
MTVRMECIKIRLSERTLIFRILIKQYLINVRYTNRSRISLGRIMPSSEDHLQNKVL